MKKNSCTFQLYYESAPIKVQKGKSCSIFFLGGSGGMKPEASDMHPQTIYPWGIPTDFSGIGPDNCV